MVMPTNGFGFLPACVPALQWQASISRDPDRAALARGSDGGFGDGDCCLRGAAAQS